MLAYPMYKNDLSHCAKHMRVCLLRFGYFEHCSPPQKKFVPTWTLLSTRCWR
jgi:hypothetical protein